MPNEDISIRLISSDTVAQNTLSATFALSSSPYNFEPGQAAVLSLSQKGLPGEGRTLSLSSAPSELPHITFATRLASGSDFKKALSMARPGDTFFLSSPFGEFVLPRGEESRFPFIFLAGGIGITPFRSMIRERSLNDLIRKKTPAPSLVTLNRTPDETPFYAECHEWNEKGVAQWFPIETRSPKAGGRSREEQVRQTMEEVFQKTGMEARIYLAGPPAMVDSLSEILTGAFGFPRERLTVDLFFGYA